MNDLTTEDLIVMKYLLSDKIRDNSDIIRNGKRYSNMLRERLIEETTNLRNLKRAVDIALYS